MKRYMDLILAILRYVEKEGNGVELDPPRFADYTETQINYHVELCGEAKYLHVSKVHSTPPAFRISRLTWAGHEFLDQNR